MKTFTIIVLLALFGGRAMAFDLPGLKAGDVALMAFPAVPPAEIKAVPVQRQTAEKAARQNIRFGSRYYWENGTGNGSQYYWTNGTQVGSQYYWENGTGNGSEYYWKNGTQAGSQYYWEHGTEDGSQYYWEHGTGAGRQDPWSIALANQIL